MSKTSPSGGATDRINDETQRLAYLIRFVREDGVVESFTDHDAPIPFNDGLGLLTYSPDEGASTSAIASLYDSTVDELEVTTFIESGGIEMNDIIAGRYDNAEIRVYLVNWDDIADGGWKMRRGNVGNIDYDEGRVRFQHLGMIQKMHSTSVVELVSSECRVKTFGDQGLSHPRCKIQLNAAQWAATTAYSPARLDESAGELAGTEEVVVRPLAAFNDRWFVLTGAGTSGGSEPSWNTAIDATTSDGSCTWTAIQARRILGASILTVTSHLEFILTGYTGDAPDAFFVNGFVEFTNANNINVKIGIATWVLSTKTVTLILPVNLLAITTDTLVLIAGCDRQITTCVNTYDNILNFRGDTYLRGNDSFFRFPDAPPAQ